MSNQHIRQLLIDLVLDNNENEILKWFSSLWNNLSHIHCDVYAQTGNEHIYYINGDTKKWIFYINTNYILCEYTLYWSKLSEKYGLGHSEMQYITTILLKHVVENKLNNNIVFIENLIEESNIHHHTMTDEMLSRINKF